INRESYQLWRSYETYVLQNISNAANLLQYENKQLQHLVGQKIPRSDDCPPNLKIVFNDKYKRAVFWWHLRAARRIFDLVKIFGEKILLVNYNDGENIIHVFTKKFRQTYRAEKWTKFIEDIENHERISEIQEIFHPQPADLDSSENAAVSGYPTNYTFFKIRFIREDLRTPLIRYPGGKTRAIETIVPFFPTSCRKLYSPFFGGGSIEMFLLKNRCEFFVEANDKCDVLINFYKCIQTCKQMVLSNLETLLPIDKQNFKIFKLCSAVDRICHIIHIFVRQLFLQ
ncbi:hypothetical protein HK096_004561, partial [Nowakowskiella sp. JEL0078]